MEKEKEANQSNQPEKVSDEKKKAEVIPPLSQREKEHLTYLKVLEQYQEAKIKRVRYKRVGSVLIVISALVFIALIFNLDTKIEFLCLWIVVVLYIVSVMIRADYRYDLYKGMLEIPDERVLRETDAETGENEVKA